MLEIYACFAETPGEAEPKLAWVVPVFVMLVVGLCICVTRWTIVSILGGHNGCG